MQWTPAELAYLHDWNVVFVPDGKDFQQVLAAQRLAAGLGDTAAHRDRLPHGQGLAVRHRGPRLARRRPRALLGRLLPGARSRCSATRRRRCPAARAWTRTRCAGPDGPAVVEACFWEALQVVRRALEKRPAMVEHLAGRLRAARERLERAGAQAPRGRARALEAVYETIAAGGRRRSPSRSGSRPAPSTTLRDELGRALHHLNQASGGALFVAAADLLGSTSVNKVAEGFPPGFWNAADEPRLAHALRSAASARTP